MLETNTTQFAAASLGNLWANEGNWMTNKLLGIGIGGTVLAALCCFTPFLPIILSALGLTSFLGVFYNDAVLLPALAIFILITGYALWRRQKQLS